MIYLLPCFLLQTLAITLKQKEKLAEDILKLLSSPEGSSLQRNQPYVLTPTISAPQDKCILYVKTLQELASIVGLQAAGGTHLAAMLQQPSTSLLTKASRQVACDKITVKLQTLERQLKVTVRWTPDDLQYKVCTALGDV